MDLVGVDVGVGVGATQAVCQGYSVTHVFAAHSLLRLPQNSCDLTISTNGFFTSHKTCCFVSRLCRHVAALCFSDPH